MISQRRPACISRGMRLTGACAAIAACLMSLPRTATADESRWRLRTGAGVLAATGTSGELDAATTVSLQRGSFLFDVDVIRTFESRAELLVGAGLPFIGFTLLTPGRAADAGSISPTGIHIGLNYRSPHRWGEVYGGPMIAGFAADRSGSVGRSDTTAAFRFPGGWGLGAGFGYRRNFGNREDCWRGCNARFSSDLNVRWQNTRLLVGEGGRVSWNPLTFTASVITRLQ